MRVERVEVEGVEIERVEVERVQVECDWRPVRRAVVARLARYAEYGNSRVFLGITVFRRRRR